MTIVWDDVELELGELYGKKKWPLWRIKEHFEEKYKFEKASLRAYRTKIRNTGLCRMKRRQPKSLSTPSRAEQRDENTIASPLVEPTPSVFEETTSDPANTPSLNNQFTSALKSSDFARCKELIDQGLELDDIDDSGHDPLSAAIFCFFDQFEDEGDEKARDAIIGLIQMIFQRMQVEPNDCKPLIEFMELRELRLKDLLSARKAKRFWTMLHHCEAILAVMLDTRPWSLSVDDWTELCSEYIVIGWEVDFKWFLAVCRNTLTRFIEKDIVIEKLEFRLWSPFELDVIPGLECLIPRFDTCICRSFFEALLFHADDEFWEQFVRIRNLGENDDELVDIFSLYFPPCRRRTVGSITWRLHLWMEKFFNKFATFYDSEYSYLRLMTQIDKENCEILEVLLNHGLNPLIWSEWVNHDVLSSPRVEKAQWFAIVISRYTSANIDELNETEWREYDNDFEWLRSYFPVASDFERYVSNDFREGAKEHCEYRSQCATFPEAFIGAVVDLATRRFIDALTPTAMDLKRLSSSLTLRRQHDLPDYPIRQEIILKMCGMPVSADLNHQNLAPRTSSSITGNTDMDIIDLSSDDSEALDDADELSDAEELADDE